MLKSKKRCGGVVERYHCERKTMKSRRQSPVDAVLSVLAAGFVLAVCAFSLPWAGGAPAAAEQVVRIGSAVHSIMSLPVYLADHGGFFQREGLKVEVLDFQGGGPPGNAALLGGSIDLLSSAFENQLKLVKQGQPVASVVGIQATFGGGLLLRKDLAQKLGRKPTVADLKGLKIGTLARGGFADSAARYIVANAGLDPDKDVILVPLRGYDKHIVAGKAGELDASLMVEPWPVVGIDELSEWAYVFDITAGEGPDVFKNIGYISLSATRSYIEKNRPTVEKVVRAIASAQAFINDRKNLDAVADIARKQFPETERATLRKSIANQIGTFSPDIVPDMVAKNAELLGKAGNIQLPVPSYEAIVDGSFKPLWKAGS
jgi:NitT/TauT family transport system substrate-binding protein